MDKQCVHGEPTSNCMRCFAEQEWRADFIEEIAALKQQLAEREKDSHFAKSRWKEWQTAWGSACKRAKLAEARVKELEAERDAWETSQQAHQTALLEVESLLTDLISAAEPFAEYLEGVDSRITHGIIERGLEVGELRALAAAAQKAREGRG